MRKPLIIIFSILLVDQILKFWIKTHMYLGQEFHIFGSNWFIIHFTENNGVAFGMELPFTNGKLFLSMFRILAVIAIGWYLYNITNKNSHWGLITSISLIFAGAMGNIIDSAFYGIIFSSSDYHVASFLPEGGGYGTFLHGKVVDMLYFPIIKGYYPDWFPFWANREFIFFRPVFNIADSSITVGVFTLLIFQKKFFNKYSKYEQAEEVIVEEKNTSIEE
ncbi:lipoprotein signal peptidase [candidate division KSB1 bacterium]